MSKSIYESYIGVLHIIGRMKNILIHINDGSSQSKAYISKKRRLLCCLERHMQSLWPYFDLNNNLHIQKPVPKHRSLEESDDNYVKTIQEDIINISDCISKKNTEYSNLKKEIRDIFDEISELLS